QEVFDPPEMERETETKIGRKGAVFKQGGNMKFEGDGHLLSPAKRDLSHVISECIVTLLRYYVSRHDCQARPAESNYVTDLRSHAYSEDPLPLGREYHRQKSYLPTSSCSWEKSSALEAAPSSPDALGHPLGKTRTRTNTFSARPDYLASYPTTAPYMRKHPGEVELDYGLDHSEHCYGRSDRFTTFSSCNVQSCNELTFFCMKMKILHHDKFSLKQMFDYARGPHYDNPISRRWCFDDGGPSLARGLQYGDEIPSLSSKKYNVAPSCSSQCYYGPQTPLFSRRHEYGDEIPSLSPNWRYRDRIPLRSGHWCHDAEAHAPSRYQQGASHRNGQSRQNFARINPNEQAKVITSKHAFIIPRVVNRAVNSSDHYRTNMKDNRCRNSEDIRDQVRGPRANKLNNTSASSTVKDIMSPLVFRDQFNRSDFSVQYKQAKFFMIKSYSEDDIHKGIKYNVWASTPNGNNKLDAAYHEAQILMKENGEKCPVFLFFSVNTSGQFVGLAEMLGAVDFKKTMDFWKEDKWNGFFPIVWHIIKDIPNRLFKHIILENNDNRTVIFSRDTQEIGLPQGVQMLKIFKDHPQGTSILDDFDFYEEKDNARRAQKRGNSESTHQATFSEDLEQMGNLEASMENWSLYENWD
ncbi:YTH domain-containing family protein 2, partial [Dichanthelium oligosanthes]